MKQYSYGDWLVSKQVGLKSHEGVNPTQVAGNSISDSNLYNRLFRKLEKHIKTPLQRNKRGFTCNSYSNILPNILYIVGKGIILQVTYGQYMWNYMVTIPREHKGYCADVRFLTVNNNNFH